MLRAAKGTRTTVSVRTSCLSSSSSLSSSASSFSKFFARPFSCSNNGIRDVMMMTRFRVGGNGSRGSLKGYRRYHRPFYSSYRCFAGNAGNLPPHIVHAMPSLSPTQTEGAIVEWLIKEGDKVEEGTEIAQIQTDKSVVAWASTDDGYLAKQLYPADSNKKLSVGTPIAIVVDDQASVAAFKNVDVNTFLKDSSKDSSQASSKPSSQPQPSQSSSSSASQGGGKKSKLPPNLPEHQIHTMPALSPTATTGRVVEWLINEGDQFHEGTELAQIQTDKSVVAWTSTDEGYLAKKLCEAGLEQPSPVGWPVAITVTDKAHVSAFRDLDPKLFIDAKTSDDSAAPKETPQKQATDTDAAPSASRAASSAPKDRVFASPYAKLRAKELNVPLSGIKGSGLRDRVTASDVEKAAKEGVSVSKKKETKKEKTSGAAAPAFPTGVSNRTYDDLPLSEMRKIIAKRLSESVQMSPHYYVTVECELDNLLAMRKEMNEGEEMKVSVNDFIIKAAARAIRDVPDVNVSWLGDKLRKYNYVDISVAVATPGGLITPIVTDADLRPLGNIAATVKELAGRARDNKLLPHEFQGGTLTISNLGMYGVKQFTAIINPPQSCIIAIGGANTVVKPDGKGGFKPVSTMLCTISSDHRSVDGALAAQYMQAFKKYIENPSKLML